jgi:hypothetical protein
MNRKRGQPGSEMVFDLEGYLDQMLPRVTPRPDFITSLRDRLLNNPPPPQSLPLVVLYLALAAAGLISGVILIATGLRALMTLLAALGFLQTYRANPQAKDAPSLHQPI